MAARVTAVCFFWHTDERVFLLGSSHTSLCSDSAPLLEPKGVGSFFVCNYNNRLTPTGLDFWNKRPPPSSGTKCRNVEETNQKGGDLKG